MKTNFDAAELLRIYGEASEKVYHEMLGINPLATMWVECDSAGILAVAAHVREQTLREAAGVCEAIYRDGESKQILNDNAVISKCIGAINALAASARETGGAK